MAWYDRNPDWALEAVNKALEKEAEYIEETNEMMKTALEIGIGSGAIIGGLIGNAVGQSAAEKRLEQKYKQIYGNAVAKVVNEHNKKLIDMSNDHYSKIENLENDLKILFTPVSVAYMLKNTVIDTIGTDTMNSTMKQAWRRKDDQYFKNLLINRVYLDAQEAEQMFIKRFIEQDKNLRTAINKKSSNYEPTEFPEDTHVFEVVNGVKYLQNLFKKAAESESIKKYANVLIEESGDWETISIPLELDSMRLAADDHFDLGMKKLSFLWFGKDNVHEMEELTPDYLKDNMSVVYLPDRVLYVTDDVVVSQLNVMNMNEEGYNKFKHRDSKFFKDTFFNIAKKANLISDEQYEDIMKWADEPDDIPIDDPLDFTGGPVSDLLKSSGMITLPDSEDSLTKYSEDSQEKEAANSEDMDFGKDGKIKAIEDAFEDDIPKQVAYMIATSHEYNKPNVKAALSFVKNYDWELSNAKISDLQGINKPVIKEKVKSIADDLNPKDIKPLVVINQLNGVRPQTPRKKILIDGHHRKEACEFLGIDEVPVYKGTYTGKAEKSYKELSEKTASISDRISYYEELFNKPGIHPYVYRIVLTDTFGNDWTTFDSETMINSIKDVFGVRNISEEVENKLLSMILVANSDAPFTGFHTFEKVIRAFNDKPIDFKMRESNLSLGEIVNGLRIIAELIDEKDDELYDAISEHVLGYITEVLMDNNYRVCAHKSKGKNEKMFWDLVNLELLHNWARELPYGLNNLPKDKAFIEAKGIQRISKDLCEKHRDNINPPIITVDVQEKCREFGFPETEEDKGTNGIVGLIFDNVLGSLAVDKFLDEKEKQKEEQIKIYIIK